MPSTISSLKLLATPLWWHFPRLVAALTFVLLALLTVTRPGFAANITVNSTGDTASAGNTQCTLREAILNANANSDTTAGDCIAGSGTDTIRFTIGAGGAQTITLSAALPTITDSIIISGATQPGFSGLPLINVDFANPTAAINLTAGNSAIYDIAMRNSFLKLTGVLTATLQNLDLSYPASCSTGASVSSLTILNSSHLIIRNVNVSQRGKGMSITGGSNIELTNNDFTGSGCVGGSSPLLLSGVGIDANTGRGIIAASNIFLAVAKAIAINNTSGLLITTSVPAGVGHYFVLEPTSQINRGSKSKLSLASVTSSTIDGIDLSDSAGSCQTLGGTALTLSSTSKMLIRNVNVSAMGAGMSVSGGSDIELINNNFTLAGCSSSGEPLQVSNVSPDGVTGRGLLAASNVFSNADKAIVLQNMSGLLITSSLPTGILHYVVLEPNSNINSISGGGLTLSGMSNSIVDGVDLSQSGACAGTGLSIASTSVSLVIRNVNVSNRNIGIDIKNSRDIEVSNNNLAGTGCNSGYALALENVSVDAGSGRGILAASNSFLGAERGVSVKNMNGVVISGTIPDSASHYIVLETSSGITVATSTAIALNKVYSSSIEGVDLSRAGACSGTGLNITNHSLNLVIRRVNASNRANSVAVRDGRNIEISNNNFNGSGCNGGDALSLTNITVEAITGRGLLVAGNTFHNATNGIALTEMSSLVISNAIPAGPAHYVVIEATSGMNTVANTPLSLGSSNFITIENLSLDYASAARSGTGVNIGSSSTNVTVRGVSVAKRVTGIVFNGGNGHQAIANQIVDNTTGISNNNASTLTVSCNNVISNTTGVNIGTGAASNLLYSENLFKSNSTAINNTNSTTVTAENNWWGVASGPSNLGGTGNPYTGLVDASPFLTGLPPCAGLPVVSIGSVILAEGNSGGSNALFAVTLSDPSLVTVSVNYASSDGSATVTNNDYNPVTGVITFMPGVTSQPLTVTINGDIIAEPREAFSVTISNPSLATLGRAVGVGSIRNDDAIEVAISDGSVLEGTGGVAYALFPVIFNQESPVTMTLQYTLTDGGTLGQMATITDSDYIGGGGFVTFAPGDFSQVISVTIPSDSKVEATETFTVTLGAFNLGGASLTITDHKALGTILNDDTTAFYVGDASVLEGASGSHQISVPITLSNQSDFTATVAYATADQSATVGYDYLGSSGLLTYTPGVTSQLVTVTVLGDILVDGTEIFHLSLQTPNNANVDDGTGAINIVDDDSNSAVIGDVTLGESNSGVVNFVFPVSITLLSQQPITIAYAVSNGSTNNGDHNGATGDLVIPAFGNSGVITVPVIGERLVERNESFTVALTQANGISITLADEAGTGLILNDDSATLALGNAAINEGNSGTVSAIFPVTMTYPSSEDVTVAYLTSDVSALAGQDYAATSGTLTIPAGNITGNITITVNSDTWVERTENFTTTLSNANGISISIATDTGVGTIANDDHATLAIHDVTLSEGASGTVAALFTVSMSDPSSEDVTVQYATSNQTASAGSDYLSTSGLLTLPAGSTSGLITVTVNGDTLVERNESFTVTLSNASGISVTIGDGAGVGLINNDDSATLAINDVTVTEGNTGTVNAIFTVSMTLPSSENVTVHYATANTSATAGPDYIAASGTLTFSPGSTSRTITVTVNGDSNVEANETYAVNLSNATGISVTILDSSAIGRITDDDATALNIDDASIVEGINGSVALLFNVTLGRLSDFTVTAAYSTSNVTALVGQDYLFASGVVTFAPGVSSQLVTVTVLGDNLVENSETFQITLGNPVSATINDGLAIGTINNDDSSAMRIGDVTLNEAHSGSTFFVFPVTLTNPSALTVTVNYATSNHSATNDNDFVTVSDILTFTPGSTSQSITITINGDQRVEANESFTLTLSSLNASGLNVTLVDGTAIGSINNDDSSELRIGDVSHNEGNSGTTLFVFPLTLTYPSALTVTVTYATSNGSASSTDSDYASTSGTITFAPGVMTQNITITVNGENRVEPTENFTLTLNNLNASALNVALSDSTAVGTINNDDSSELHIGDVALNEGNGGATLFIFPVTLTNPSAVTVTIDFATGNGSSTTSDGDYTASSGTLTFRPGIISQNITVTVTGDDKVEAGESFTLTLSNLSAGGLNVTLGDGSAVGSVVNDDSSLMRIGDVSVTETQGGTVNAIFPVTLTQTSAATVTVSYATANGSASSSDNDYVTANGSLTFAPGVISQNITITINGDQQVEYDESFSILLSGLGNAGLNVSLLDDTGVGAISNDDSSAMRIGDTSLSEGQSGSLTALFSITLTHPAAVTVTVNYATHDGSASSMDSDYVARSDILTFAPGVISQTVAVLVNGDSKVESNEDFTVALTSLAAAGLNLTLTDSLGSATLLNDDSSELRIGDVTQNEGNSGATLFVFPVTLTQPSALTVTVNYVNSNGSANSSDSDYATASGTVTFAPGIISQNITITVNGDNRVEPLENFTVTLSGLNAGGLNITLSDSVAVGTINNDDTSELRIGTVALNEGHNGSTLFVLPVTLTNPSAVTVTIDFATSNGSASTADGDYVAISGTLSYAPGVTSQSITVTINGDNKVEPTETFTTTLSGLSAGGLNVTLGIGSGVATVVNDDSSLIRIGDASVSETNGGTINVLFPVTLSNSSAVTVTLNYATSNGSASNADNDYLVASGSLTFAPGVTNQQITITINGDPRVEYDETFNMLLSDVNNAGLNVTVFDDVGIGTIRNDDSSELRIGDVSVVEGQSGSLTALFPVTLSHAAAVTVTVNYATSNGSASSSDSDYATTNGLLTFAPGLLSQTVSVLVTGDNKVEANEDFTVTLASLDAAGLTVVLADGVGKALLLNDDSSEMRIGDGTQNEGNSGATLFAFPVTLTQPSALTVTVNYVLSNGSASSSDGDYTAASGALTFAPGIVTQHITVTVTGDNRVETDENFTVVLSNFNAAGLNLTLNDGVAVGNINNDDSSLLRIGDVTLNEGHSGATLFVFPVTLTNPSAVTVTVHFTSNNGSATTIDGDYATVSGTLTFRPGITSQNITVTVTGDQRVEMNEDFSLTLGELAAGGLSVTVVDGSGLATIGNDDSSALGISDVTLSEGQSGMVNAIFLVTLTNPSAVTVTIDYATSDGTAQATSGDYAANNGTLTFAPGNTSQNIMVAVNGDPWVESGENFMVVLTSLNNAGLNVSLSDNSGLAVINNDDSSTLSIGDVSLLEGGNGATHFVFPLILTQPSAQPVIINFASNDDTAAAADTDYASISGSLVFAPGVLSQQITVTVQGDNKVEANESFFVLLANLNAGGLNISLVDGSALGTIVNDDFTALTIGAASVVEGDSGAVTAIVAVTLSNPSVFTVTVGYQASNGTALAGSDYAAVTGVITFAAGVRSQSLAIMVYGDTLIEGNESLPIALINPTNAIIQLGNNLVTIIDDDTTPVNIGSVTISEGSGMTSTMIFPLSLSKPNVQPITLTYTLNPDETDGSDHDGRNGSLVLPALSMSATITVAVNGDWRVEQNESFTIKLTSATGISVTIDHGVAVGTILNDDAATLSVQDVTVTEGDNGTVAAQFAILMSHASSEDVTVAVATSDQTANASSDYNSASTHLTFPGETTIQTFTVLVNSDLLGERDETFAVTLTDPTGISVTLTDSTAVGNILNDDSSALTIADVVLDEGDDGTTDAVFHLSMSKPSSEEVTVAFATGDNNASAGIDYVGASGVLAFPIGTTSNAITVTLIGDRGVEAHESFSLTLSNPSGISVTLADEVATGLINNDDYRPTASPQALAFREDEAISIHLAGSDSDNDPLNYTIVTSTTLGLLTLITESVSYQPNANANGVDGFTYQIGDGVNASGLITVSLAISPVNDSPSFSAGASITVNENASHTIVAGWATNLLAGPTNEASQVLSFTLVNDNPTLFAQQPALAVGNGNLTFKPALDRFGSAVVTVTLTDNGGIADGGVDRTAPYTFTITVTLDTDGDGLADINDSDDDNDNVLDSNDRFPLDRNEWLDSDNDGQGNNADPDDDNDQQTDSDEVACGSNPLDSASRAADFDGDLRPDCVDSDIDNDGSIDVVSMTVSQTVSTKLARPGETITYTYLVTNTGTVSLTVQASDQRLGALSTVVLVGQASGQITRTYTISSSDWPGPLVNSLLVTGTPTLGKVVTGTAQSSVALTATTAISLGVARITPDPIAPGATVVWQITISNTGDLEVVIDQLSGGLLRVADVQVAAVDIGLEGESAALTQATGTELINPMLPVELLAVCSTPIRIASKSAHVCTITQAVTGNAGETLNFEVTVSGHGLNEQGVNQVAVAPLRLSQPSNPGATVGMVYLPLIVR